MRMARWMIAAAVLIAPSTAFAGETQSFTWLSTTLLAGGALTVGGAVTTVVVVVAHESRKNALNQYLKQNEVAVRAATTLGGGEALNDIAMLLEVPAERRSQFARDVRRHRRLLAGDNPEPWFHIARPHVNVDYSVPTTS